MTASSIVRAGLLLAGGLLVAACATASRDAASGNLDARVAATLELMTLEEKIGLLHGPMALSFGPTAPELPSDAIPGAGYIPGLPRLGIPALRETDAGIGVTNPGGVRTGDGSTSLPSGLAVASTWNPERAYAGGVVLGREAADKGFNVLLAGAANLVREPRNGRNFEYPGEDPLLGGVIVGNAIRGAQDQGVISTTKHYAINSQETGRQVLSANIEEAAFRESDLLLFEIAIEIGDPGSVMCAYNRINGQYACENAFTLNEVLKGDWGWRGWVMSDWGAVHSTVDAAMNGLDQQSGEQLDDAPYFSTLLLEAVQAGQVPESRIDDMAGRILRTMYRFDVSDAPPALKPSDYDAHAAVTQAAAEEAIVLLKNEGGLLPLAPATMSIAVISGHADKGVLSGGGSSQVWPVGGPAATIPVGIPGMPAAFGNQIYHPGAPLDAIREAFPNAAVSFSDGADPAAAAAAAASADVAIVFATQWATEFLDVAGGLTLQNDQDALIAAVAAANPRTIVVLETGGPVLTPWLEMTPAVLEAWYSGTRGAQAIANVLSGAVNPSGRLPVTFPANVDQLPSPMLPGSELAPGLDGQLLFFEVDYAEGADVGYRWYETRGHTPLFPFGYGLSYTSFEYGDLEIADGRTLTVSFDLTNTGDRAGAEAAQLYVRPPQPGEARRLAAFSKVELQPGETRRVTLTADRRLLAQFDVDADRWRIDAGGYEVAVGRSATDFPLRGTARLRAQSFEP
jgi:beta-glucosidase